MSGLEIEGEPALAAFFLSIGLTSELQGIFANFCIQQGSGSSQESTASTDDDPTVKSTMFMGETTSSMNDSRSVVACSADLLASVFGFVADVTAAETEYNAGNLDTDPSLNFKEWFNIFPRGFDQKLLPIIFKSLPRLQVFVRDMHYEDLVVSLADFMTKLIERQKVMDKFPGTLESQQNNNVGSFVTAEPLILMSYQLFKMGYSSHLPSAFDAISRIMAFKETSSASGMSNNLDDKHLTALLKMVDHLLEESGLEGTSHDSLLGLCALWDIPNASQSNCQVWPLTQLFSCLLFVEKLSIC